MYVGTLLPDRNGRDGRVKGYLIMGMKELFEESLMEQFDQEQQEYELEMHERTHGILSYLVDVLSPEDFSLMCYHCGFSVHEFLDKE